MKKIITLLTLGFLATGTGFACAFFITSQTSSSNTPSSPTSPDLDHVSSLLQSVQSLALKSDSLGSPVQTIPPEDTNHIYYTFLNRPLTHVNLAPLKQTYPDITTWLTISGTGIDLPLPSTTSKTFYQTHTLDQSENPIGWPFLYTPSQSSQNTFLIANGILDGSPFSELKLLISNGWLNHKENFVLSTSDQNQDSLWEVFSLYKTDQLQLEDTILTTPWDSLEFARTAARNSVYDFSIPLTETDHFLTIISYSDSHHTIVLHAKQIKQSTV